MSPTPKTQVVILLPLKKQTLNLLREEFPKVEFHYQPIKSVQELNHQIVEKAKVIITDMVIPAAGDVPELEWLHIFKTVVDVRLLGEDLIAKQNLVVTNNSGVTAPAYADIALMQIFSLGYHLMQVCEAKKSHNYVLDEGKYGAARLYDSTVGVVGYGSVGREIARITHAFGVQLLAVKRDLLHPEDQGYYLPSHGDPGGDYFQRLYPPQAIASMVKECDFVLVTVPHTAETYHLINAEVLAQMKPSAYLINLSMPEVIDIEALTQALTEKQIAGAALVQFPEHEFSTDSALWTLDQVLIFPSFSSLIQNEEEKAVLLLIENLKQYLNGGPLTNRINFERGY
jgi:phosphoglycerate dehydrogenase-like enzyme